VKLIIGYFLDLKIPEIIEGAPSKINEESGRSSPAPLFTRVLLR
jgi:hypothetical protein